MMELGYNIGLKVHVVVSSVIGDNLLMMLKYEIILIRNLI